jgi:hypothetical protein
MSDEVSLRLDWADFEPADDRQAMALALLTAGIVVETDDKGNELPGDLVRLNFDLADIVLDALASTGRSLATLDAAREQAATEVHRELLAKVEGLPLYQNAESGVTTTETTTNRLREYRAAVLRLIEAPGPSTKEPK